MPQARTRRDLAPNLELAHGLRAPKVSARQSFLQNEFDHNNGPLQSESTPKPQTKTQLTTSTRTKKTHPEVQMADKGRTVENKGRTLANKGRTVAKRQVNTHRFFSFGLLCFSCGVGCAVFCFVSADTVGGT